MKPEQAVRELQVLLNTVPPGTLAEGERDGVVQLLAAGWSMLEGSDSSAMAASKLPRVESLEWNPRNLSFVIERHGALAMGSSRAKLHEWTVDIAHRTASYTETGYRQIGAQASRWYAGLQQRNSLHSYAVAVRILV